MTTFQPCGQHEAGVGLDFHWCSTERPVTAGAAVSASVSAAEVGTWLTRLATESDLPQLAQLSGGELCEVLTELELLKNAAAAAQARVALVAAEMLQAEAIEAGTPVATAEKGVRAQLALARRESPHRAARHLGLARAVVTEMPQLHAAMTAGLVGEWSATQLVQATACLSIEHRQQVDEHLTGRYGHTSDHALAAAARAKAYELDPYAYTNQGRRAAQDRRVTLRPAPDVMSLMTGYLPVAEGVACYAALDRDAKALKATGDARSMNQLRADLLVARLTGHDTVTQPSCQQPRHVAAPAPQDQPSEQPSEQDAPGQGVGIELGLVMTDRALTGSSEEPAHLTGYGPIPAPYARDLLSKDARIWLRRLYHDPATGVLHNQDPRRRHFPERIRRYVIARDQVCRTPWCTAPIRHTDHIIPYAAGGQTTHAQGAGLCEACNYAKEASGLAHEPVPLPDGTTAIKITTGTGHTHYSLPPPVLPTLPPPDSGATLGTTLPTSTDPPDQDSPLERHFDRLLQAVS